MNKRRRRKGKCFLDFGKVRGRFVGLFRRFGKIRRRCAGETLIEQLASMLVVSLSVLILAGAISAAAKVDARTRNFSKRENLQSSSQRVSASALSVRLPRSDGVAIAVPVSVTAQTLNGKKLYRYEAP